MPPSVDMQILYDRSVSIRESVDDVKFTLFLAVVLVVLVIFLFLRNLSATVIPSIALPMSIIGTFAVMYELNYTVDNLSFMALTLSVGFVVDDAIVMLENIVRHMEMGEGVMEAALSGSREIGFTIVSMTLVAGRRLHSRPVHGRDHGPSSSRVFRGDHGCDSRLGVRLAHSDADALQPLPALATRREARPRLYVARAILRPPACGLRRLVAMVAPPSPVGDGGSPA